jgi:lipopolysaccharide export LptBFGC system permease protein LptF
MGRVDLYILRQIIPIMLVTLFISVVVLLLEKMLQLLNLTVGSGVSSFVVLQMIVSLFPNYIRLVLPLGLFLGIFITFRRLSTQSELHAFYAAVGRSGKKFSVGRHSDGPWSHRLYRAHGQLCLSFSASSSNQWHY